MATLKLDAYIPSKGEYEKYFDKFRAFMSADLSEKADEQGAYHGFRKGKGWYPLRSAMLSDSPEIFIKERGRIVDRFPLYSPNSIAFGDEFGELDWFSSTIDRAGLRVAFKVIYNPNSSLVKGCRIEKRTTLVYDIKTGENINVTSSAPIVKFGNKDCIWLNKEGCENGKSKEMELWTLDLIEKAEPFDEDGYKRTNDFAKATELIAQCDRVLKENCTKEELDMIVPVEMSSEDNYEKTTPIYENEDDYDDISL